jgi:serine/threonine protein kinase
MQAVALKSLKENLNDNSFKEFMREIKLVKSLNSPSIVRVFGVAELDGEL